MRLAARRSILTGATVAALTLAVSAPADSQTVDRDVVFVPTPQEVVDRMLEVAEVSSDDIVYDLGSGDGRIPVTAAKTHGARATGIEIDPELIKRARQRAEDEGVTDKVEFRNANIFETDFSDATVITLYLLEQLNVKLRPTLLELRPGTRIVSHAFSMREWEPDVHETVSGRNVYSWIVPARVQGTWEVSNAEHNFSLELTQEFQMIEGEAEIDGETVALQDAELRGDEISFELEIDGEREAFHGQVEEDRIVPRDAPDASDDARVAKDWRATRAS